MKKCITTPIFGAINLASKAAYSIQDTLVKFKKTVEVITVSIVFIIVTLLFALGIGRAIDIEYADYGDNPALVSQDK